MILKNKSIHLFFLLTTLLLSPAMKSQDKFPDGTPIPKWFKENKPTEINKLGKKYSVTANGVKNDSTILQTKEIQAIIDLAAKNGGGVIVVPKLKGYY